MTENLYEIYTDGACRGNPGVGGWGVYNKTTGKKLYGHEKHTTNNKMELTAAINGILNLATCDVQHNDFVIIYTDSTYVKNGITTWIHNWKSRDWKTAQNKPVQNKHLWVLLDKLTQQYSTNLSWQWVKAHAACKGNIIADALANQAIDEMTK